MAAIAGVRKGRAWFFLTPAYWCGTGGVRRSNKHAVQTSRWACSFAGRRDLVPSLAGPCNHLARSRSFIPWLLLLLLSALLLQGRACAEAATRPRPGAD